MEARRFFAATLALVLIHGATLTVDTGGANATVEGCARPFIGDTPATFAERFDRLSNSTPSSCRNISAIGAKSTTTIRYC